MFNNNIIQDQIQMEQLDVFFHTLNSLGAGPREIH